MSLSETALFLDEAGVPPVAAVAAKVGETGHLITFPARFSMTNRARSGWINVTLDGEKTGFDYTILPLQSFLGHDPEAPAYPSHGDTVLCFVARGSQSSIMAMMLVKRAICELSDAQGWWQEGEECLSNEEMIAFCSGSIESIKANPRPAASARQRFDSDYFRLVGKSLIFFGAVMLGIYALAALVGHVFGRGATQ